MLCDPLQFIPSNDLDALVEWLIYQRCPHPVTMTIHWDEADSTGRLWARERCGCCAANLDTYGTRPVVPAYSTDIALAWPLATAYRITLTPLTDYWEAACCNWHQSGEVSGVGTTGHRSWTRGATAPEAIVRVALARARNRLSLNMAPLPPP